MSLSRAMIIGNLGQDPEIRYTQIPPQNLERALKALHAVAALCSADDDQGPPYTETAREEYLTVRQAPSGSDIANKPSET
jgi:single-stranded DNA-binding protein